MPLLINRRFTFCAGHRLYGHEGHCAQIHGHNYEAEVLLKSTTDLDGVGRVVDFQVVKDLVGQWIDTNWDHSLLLGSDDPLADPSAWPDACHDAIANITTLPANPTAENMAQEFLDVCTSLLREYPVAVISVTIWETPTCWAKVAW